jgi:DNA-binding transcriptional MerR regulator
VADNSVEIPNRAAFKASEVCEIAQIPSYVLRSWEKEFPRLGAAGRPGGPRIYRRSDVEQILRIKQLVFAEGLTLAGARRRIEGDHAEEEPFALDVPVSVPEDLRARVSKAKDGLRSLLEMLSQPGPSAVPSPAGAVDVTNDAQAACSDSALPLLSGVPDAASKPRRARRASKEGRGTSASNVE